jgi:hypothetical protein
MYYFPKHAELKALEDSWNDLPAAEQAMADIKAAAVDRIILLPPLARGYLPNIIRASGAKKFGSWQEFLKASEKAFEERRAAREAAEARRVENAIAHSTNVERLLTRRTGKTERDRMRGALNRYSANRAARAQAQAMKAHSHGSGGGKKKQK